MALPGGTGRGDGGIAATLMGRDLRGNRAHERPMTVWVGLGQRHVDPLDQ